jgi:exopolyphosphatase/guanosine-5'-triphosphate,3'-diphosphate pyrophosphatase
MTTRRLAAIDIGTVTCRMLVADVEGDRLQAIDREYAITNLGVGVDATGVLDPAAIDRVEAQVRRYLHVLEGLRQPGQPPIPIIAMATSASRDAENADEFVDRLAALGVSLTVIPGNREAGLSFAGATAAFPGKTLLVVDVGGGSTELIVGRAGEEPQLAHSFNIGCRRVTERFFRCDPPSDDERTRAQEWMHAEFASYFQEMAARGIRLDDMVAVAGTATSVVAIDKALAPYDSAQVHGSRVPRAKLDAVHERLGLLTESQRREVVGLDLNRAPVIFAGTLILKTIVDMAGLDGFTVSEADILEGILLDYCRQQG